MKQLLLRCEIHRGSRTAFRMLRGNRTSARHFPGLIGTAQISESAARSESSIKILIDQGGWLWAAYHSRR
jgi:hypothetical protein